MRDVVRPAVSSSSRESISQNGSGYLRPAVVLATRPGILTGRVDRAAAVSVPASEPGPEPTPAAAPEPQPAYFTYTVQPGDTVASIAASFGIEEKYVLWNNAEVSDDPDLLVVGEKLAIPSVNGIIYQLKLGDNLSDVASVYQIDVQNITGFLPNQVSSPDSIAEGAVLLLPGAVPPPPPIPAAVVAVADSAPLPEEPSGEPPPAHIPSSTGYIWPSYGNITTYYGDWHLAIDIDGFGNYGAPVVAAASGQVVLATWDDWGLGYHVIIQHDDGSRTLYAHLSDIYVVQGLYVAQGEAIGALGCTGYCTGTHLHFGLWIGGVPVDPLAYLS